MENETQILKDIKAGHFDISDIFVSMLEIEDKEYDANSLRDSLITGIPKRIRSLRNLLGNPETNDFEENLYRRRLGRELRLLKKYETSLEREEEFEWKAPWETNRILRIERGYK